MRGLVFMLGLLGGIVGGFLGEIGRSTADIPANINVNFIRWFSTRPFLILCWVVLFAAALGLATVSDWGYLLGFLLVLAACAYFFRIWKFFWYGSLSPAIVISEQPLTIAAYADLAQNQGFFPYVKISHYHTTSPVKLGERVVTLAGYVPAIAGRKWADFRPVPLELATANSKVIATAVERIPSSRWKILEDAIATLPQPFVPGLFEVNPAALDQQSVNDVIAPSSQELAARKVNLTMQFILGGVLAVIAIGVFVFLNSDPYGSAVRTGDSSAKAGDYKAAASAYNTAISTEPEKPLAYFHRAVMYQRAAEHLKAQADFDEVIRLRPDFGPAYRLRVFTMQALRMNERAAEDAATADRLNAPKAINDPFGLELE